MSREAACCPHAYHRVRLWRPRPEIIRSDSAFTSLFNIFAVSNARFGPTGAPYCLSTPESARAAPAASAREQDPGRMSFYPARGEWLVSNSLNSRDVPRGGNKSPEGTV